MRARNVNAITVIAILFVCLALNAWRFEATAQESEENRRRSETHERAGKDLLKSARDKFEDGEYWQSAIDLIIILDLYPIYSKLDHTIYLLGNCLYEMGLYDAADRAYRYLLKSVPKTSLVPQALHALQKVEYHRNDYQKSLKLYQALDAHYSDSDVIDAARYYALQTHYHLQNFTLVLSMTEYIDKNSEYYPFAKYTAGLTYLKKKACGKLWKTSFGSAKPRPTAGRGATLSTRPG